MKPKLRNFLLVAALLALSPALCRAQQYTLTQTTLSAAISNSQTSFALASVTGITVSNNTNATDIYIDRELMQVTAVNSTTSIVSVLRGVGGQSAAHASGDMVLASSPAAFINFDPSGACSTTAPTGPTMAVPAQPAINVYSGAQWLCSSVTGNWVPGFGNYGLSGTPVALTAAVASAAGAILPSGPLFHITGALAITGFTIPTGFNATAAGGGGFCVVPDGAFTTTAAGNIALASTAVVNRLLCWTWDAKNSKFVPSY
ncbi:MAG: hypothetical protein ACRD2O_00070 [Terriglobia bacterium]